MCGIAGYVQRASSPHGRPIEAMTRRLAHRGPDGQGIWEGRFGEWTIALGHRRLSIIDPAHGHQPLANEDQSAWITYNGEVYNFALLRHDLESRGHRFATHCDTEAVLLHCHDAGEPGLARLQGMFAFALWDHQKGRLLLARDRIGIKPLYYAPLPDGGLAFASELTALLAHPAVDRALDPEGLSALFFLDYIPPPHAIVRGARKLEPGHSLNWSAEDPRPTKRAYWQLQMHKEAASAPVETLRQKLDEAVDAQMIADVPLGMFLSGGIDSSLVAALAQRHRREPLKTFSIAFDDPDFDESRYARLVASHIRSEHIERTLSEATLLATLDRALDCLDEPIGDSSIVPTYLLSELAAEHVKVALGGDGGDELWAGYPTYRALAHARVYVHVPATLRKRLLAPLVRSLPVRQGYQSLEWKLKRFALRWDDAPAVRHLRWMSSSDWPDVQSCVRGGADRWPEGVARLLEQSNGDWDLNCALAMDLKSYLPGAVLTKVDRASMAHGLEVRPPMLHEPLIDFAFSQPMSAKLDGRTSKAMLKQAARGVLPDEIIDRPKKGFAIPLARWLNGPLRGRLNDVLGAGRIWESEALDRCTFQRWSGEHHRGEVDRSKPLWALLVLEHFYSRLLRAA
jgi:asparagine synthase (glutamine-hydrolysing)